VEQELIERASLGEEAAFDALADSYRRDLQLHCYRILGSFHDAEDAVQETLLAAWRSISSFEGRSSLRTWLLRIATNRCLNMLRAGRKEKPAENLSEVKLPKPTRLGEILWLEPYPDSLLEGVADKAPGPDALYETRESVSLAFVTALQLLPPRQRAALILRDVLGYRAREVAAMLDSTEESVTSALKRARATLNLELPRRVEAAAPDPGAERDLVDRFVEAFEARDLDGLVGLLTEDVWFTMPPLPLEYQGRDAALKFLQVATPRPSVGRRLVETRANGQPAVGMYFEDPRAGVLRLVGLLVLTLDKDGISAITRFDHTALEAFDLPRSLPIE
jgi:RNA polymerase sigma-70 factor, ECF subfamily